MPATSMTIEAPVLDVQVNYARKLYAFLDNPNFPSWGKKLIPKLACLQGQRAELEAWWQSNGDRIHHIASSSDRPNFSDLSNSTPTEACHPLSGQKHPLTDDRASGRAIPEAITACLDPEQVYWWFWRFYPEWRELPGAENAVLSTGLLKPAHAILPDCPLHSYQTTVAALATACEDAEGAAAHPYLLLFSFSPIQDFIKASRKFLDFWAGSYLLHYLSARLCWAVAQRLGPDAIITPSLWSQEIIDALLLQKYPDFQPWFEAISPDGQAPVDRWHGKQSTSLSTAGFPNAIVLLLPGKDQAQGLGEFLTQSLTAEWAAIARQVRDHIRTQVSSYTQDKLEAWPAFLTEIKAIFPDSASDSEPYQDDLRKWSQHSNWEWRSLWEAQIHQSWEPYWSALPLGKVGQPLTIESQDHDWDEDWIALQQAVAQAQTEIPTPSERAVYPNLNVGTWWGSLQQRLRLVLNSVKAQRNWQIPIAPGNRSTISGQYSAVHPRLNHAKFAEGAGLPEGKMRFFWWVMAQAYPGLFDGSEQLNALELTKRMAWGYGGVTQALGIASQDLQPGKQPDYESLVRFPNLSSIAAAHFAATQPKAVDRYWRNLASRVNKDLIKAAPTHQQQQERRSFFKKAKRPLQIHRSDTQLFDKIPKHGMGYNGVMFSSKWLAEDMNLPMGERPHLRAIVDEVHQQSGFHSGSPADWWVILLADGDGMGGFVSGQKLEPYGAYVPEAYHGLIGDLAQVQKRMGPATHVGLNRALLDFSNRLVPYLTEQRFCGKVVYSGGDDVMAVLPLEDLPEYLLSLRAAWQGAPDPQGKFTCGSADASTGYWHPTASVTGLPQRPLFTMGRTATLSAGVVIAHKSVPLPTVLEGLWSAEKDEAKQIPGKDGLCFRVIYGNGNQLTARMPGRLLKAWWACIRDFETYGDKLAPVLHRLAQELPQRIFLDPGLPLTKAAAKVLLDRREEAIALEASFQHLLHWLNDWEAWVFQPQESMPERTTPLTAAEQTQELDNLGHLLRFTAFWVAHRVERQNWSSKEDTP